MINSKYLYKCSYCNKQFMKESAFMKHECTLMLRNKEVQSIVGQQAYVAYKHWLEKQRRKAPPIETFISSQYYNSIFKFAEFCRETGVGDPELYIDLMVKQNLSPALWRRDEAYTIYLDHIDRHSDPLKQCEDTADQLATIAERLDCPLPQVFEKLHFGEILTLVQQRKLSPWLLFFSDAFKRRRARFSDNEKEVLIKTIGGSGRWSLAFDKVNPAVKQTILEVIKGLGL